MTYLELCRLFYRESGESFSAPDTVEGAGGYDALVAGWIKQAWLDIQQLHPCWKWMWGERSFNTNTSDRDYIYPSGVARADCNTLTIEPNGAPNDAETLLFRGFDLFRHAYHATANVQTGKPSVVTEMPNGKLRFDVRPDAIYTVRFEGFATDQEMANNTDVPLLPAKYHKLIVWRALLDYGRWEASSEQYQGAQVRYTQLLGALELDQLPELTLNGGSLA